MTRRPNRDLLLAHEEKQVLSYLMGGLYYAEIAKEMNASVVTVRGWARRMRDKCGARTNEQAVYMACEKMWRASTEPVQPDRL